MPYKSTNIIIINIVIVIVVIIHIMHTFFFFWSRFHRKAPETFSIQSFKCFKTNSKETDVLELLLHFLVDVSHQSQLRCHPIASGYRHKVIARTRSLIT